MQTEAPPLPLDSTGIKVMLAIFAGFPLWRREGDSGLRIGDDGPGHVLVESVITDPDLTDADGWLILVEAEQYLLDAGLMVRRPMAIRPTLLVRRAR